MSDQRVSFENGSVIVIQDDSRVVTWEAGWGICEDDE